MCWQRWQVLLGCCIQACITFQRSCQPLRGVRAASEADHHLTVTCTTQWPVTLLPVAGWKERTSWEVGLKKTVEWYLEHGFDSYWNSADVEQALAPHPVMHSKQNKELS